MAPVIADAGTSGTKLRARIRGESIACPDLLRIEVLSVIRRQTQAGALTVAQANAAVDDLLELPLVVYPTAPLLRRSWTLRDTITAYDGCYIALAEALDCTLLTADVRLANSPGPRCAIEII